MSDHTHCKEVFCIFKWKFLYFNLCLLPLGSSEKIVSSSVVFYYFNPFWYLHILIRSTEPSLHQVNNSNSLSLSLYDTSSILLIIFVSLHHYGHVFLVLGSPELDTGLKVWSHQCLTREEELFPLTYGQCLAVVGCLFCNCTLLVYSQHFAQQLPGILFCKAASQAPMCTSA